MTYSLVYFITSRWCKLLFFDNILHLLACVYVANSEWLLKASLLRNVCRRLWYRLVYIRYLCVFNFSMFSMCVLFTLFECGLFRQLEWQCVLFWHRILLNHGLNNLIVGISTAFKQIAKWSSSLCLIWMVRTVEHSLNAVILYCGGCLHYVFWKILICTMLFLCTNHDTQRRTYHCPLTMT